MHSVLREEVSGGRQISSGSRRGRKGGGGGEGKAAAAWAEVWEAKEEEPMGQASLHPRVEGTGAHLSAPFLEGGRGDADHWIRLQPCISE
jgi:hypothetical protein